MTPGPHGGTWNWEAGVLDRFAIHQPESVAEASAMLKRWGDEASIYAGGTELLIVMKERLAHFPHLIDVKRIPGLREIGYDAERGELRIGATATHWDIERSPLVRERIPVLAMLAANVANVRVRAAGTIGGNLCFAEPHSDPAALLTALGARLTLVAAEGTREIAMEAFTTGLMETARRHDEVLTRVTVPVPDAGTGVAYERFKLHERPTAAVAAVIEIENGAIAAACIVAGSLGERPQRLTAAEAALVGMPATAVTAARGADVIHDEVMTTGDVFESEAYKRQLAKAVGRRAIETAIQGAGGSEGRRHAA
jgi:aerobic carbon-monoxide dehydrogenase medium subunit